MKNDFLSFFDSHSLVIAATRYYIGRMTIAACFHAGELAKAWESLPESIKNVIIRDLEIVFKDDDESRLKKDNKWHPLGMDMDREAWEKVRKCYENDPIS